MVQEGAAAGGRVPIVVRSAPEALICLAAPWRCTTPEPSRYQAGGREPNPALALQFWVLTGIGWGAKEAAPVRAAAAGPAA